MSRQDTLARLEALQERFSAILRTPLDRTTGKLVAQTNRYAEDELLASIVEPARARLAVYHRQYWFRLFTALQNEFRLTARLMSFWVFNDYASRFLTAHPPRSADLHRAADGFEAFLARELPEQGMVLSDRAKVPRAALLEAARIDQAHRSVFAAPLQPPLVLTPEYAAQLAGLQLRPAATVALLEEHWPLVDLRRKLAREPSEHTLSLPAAHDTPRWWALFQSAQGLGVHPLAPLQARLLSLLCVHPVGEALLRLESEAGHRPGLAAEVQAWLAESVRMGFWRSLAPATAEHPHA